MASSSRMRFWSGLPPRTEKPEPPSEVACTPGNSWMAFNTSTSPMKAGIFLISRMLSLLTLIWGLTRFSARLSPLTTTSPMSRSAGCNAISSVVSPVRVNSILTGL